MRTPFGFDMAGHESSTVVASTPRTAQVEQNGTDLEPVAPGERISSVDVIRGVALLGILLINIVEFGLPGAAVFDPSVAGGDTGVNLLTWFLNHVLFEGKMRALFSMLFGAGVILLTSRAEARGGEARIADIYYRRTLWLIAFGLLHAYFLWEGDVLYFYGIVGLMLYPLRKAPAFALITAGVVLLALLSTRSFVEARAINSLHERAAAAHAAAAAGKTLTDAQRDAQKAWEDELKGMRPDTAAIEKNIAAHRAGYWTLFRRRAHEAESWQSIFFYRFGFLDVAGMMLIGMGLLKLGVLSASRSTRFYKVLIVVGYALGLPLNAYTGYRYLISHFNPIMLNYNFALYALSRFLVALGHIGVIMLICKAGALRGLTARLAAVGRLALTNYLGQTIICTTLFNGSGFGLFGKLERYQLMLVVAAVWLVELHFSPLWLRFFRFGPMEWVWRSLTYWRLQPMGQAGSTSPTSQ